MTDALPTDDSQHGPSWYQRGIKYLRPSHVHVPIRRLFADNTTAHAAIGFYWILRFLKEESYDEFCPFSLVDVEAFICKTVHKWIVGCREGAAGLSTEPDLPLSLPGVRGDRPAEIAVFIMEHHVTAVLAQPGVFKQWRNEIHPDRYAADTGAFEVIDRQDLTAPPEAGTTTVMEAATPVEGHGNSK